MDADGIVMTVEGGELPPCDGLDSKRICWGITYLHLCGGEDIGSGNGSRCEVRAGGVEMNFVSDDIDKCVMLLRKVRP